jgi:diguanylate cyclase (GGDEF)-like protein
MDKDDVIFPNSRVEKYFNLCQELLDFRGLSWWLIDLEEDPGLFYCNATMRKTFALDDSLLAHSVVKTCPIAGDYNQNIAIRSTELAKQIFSEYSDLRNGKIAEYCNRFPYYDQRVDEVFYYSSRAKALVRDDNNNAVLLLGIIEPEFVSSELYLQAKTDGLTGLLNRREFDSQLEFLLQLASRNHFTVSMIMCDIDYFKEYNDALGHYAGDDCLKQVSATIKKVCSRSIDQVFRYGGEEFAVLIMDDKEHMPNLVDEIFKEIDALKLHHPDSLFESVTISAGYATIQPSFNTSGKELIEMADKALYKAKD